MSLDCGILTIDFQDSALRPPRDPAETKRFRSGHIIQSRGTELVTGRIILSGDRFNNSRNTGKLYSECNGAVIDARTWRHLVIPPRAFSRQCNRRDIDPFLEQDLYDIVQVSDGTVVTIYQWEHPLKGLIWCLATSKGYDVSHLYWMGKLSFAEVVYELLAKHAEFVAATGLELLRDHLEKGDVRLNFGSLDPGHCYTIGFRHKNFHPMESDPEAIWNIQTANLRTGEVRLGMGLPAIPRQATFSLPDIRRLVDPTIDDSCPVSVKMFDQLNKTALEDAKKAISMGVYSHMIPPVEGLHVCPFNYGFILRSRNVEITGPHSDVLCESSLLRRVRGFIYRRPPRAIRDEIDHINRQEYNTLKAFLTRIHRVEFLALFPQAKPKFAYYAQFIKNIVHSVIHMHRQDKMGPGMRDRNGIKQTRIKKIAKGMLEHILTYEESFKAFDASASEIVHDYIVKPEYTMLYLVALRN